jgi:chorismate mutase / prephenate dehydratase
MSSRKESGVTADSASDPRLIQLRREISDTDRAVVELVNKRLKLVATIKDYKAHRGMEFVDPDRERWMRKYLHWANRGPLSAAGLDELFQEILDLTKREVARLEADERQASGV